MMFSPNQIRGIPLRGVILAFVSLFTVIQPGPGRADDWPQWMGPNRDGVYSEDGVVDRIPADGLPVLWRAEIGGGYSGPAVVGNRVFVSDFVADSGKLTNGPGTRDQMVGTERTLCLDASTGKMLWKYELSESYALSFAAGPRATPTVDGDRVYVLGAEGYLACLEVESGKEIWHREIAVDFPSPETPIWGFAAHPLVHGNALYCLGGKDSVAICLDKLTGKTIWSALSSTEIGYCPPNIFNLGGREQLVVWHPAAVNGLDPQTGNVLWSHEVRPQYGMSIAAPVRQGDKIFVSGIGKSSALLQMDSNGMPTKSVWDGRTGAGVYSGNSTAIFESDCIFGSDCETGLFMAIDPASGERLWETFELTTGGERRASHGTAFVVKHADKYFIFTETGDLLTVKLDRAGFEITGRQHIVDATNFWQSRSVVWSHPAFANRCVFARNDKEIVCVSLAAEQ